ncbi:hypothetical protein [Yersinia enterocolitica]|nr:hypothetical protein [Yersinia enterocolitica]AJJ28189.1 virion export protein [Yersinia enterocolitica]MDA5484952.1 hypothetical protein [Yersinia enterocolitica]CNF62616.1 Type II secretory pathway%2C component HofQ [Yersinia enterocolitica]CNH26262.1 Type II secretory pathway%2C component HofQ [Yersinia enterocolitica]
MGNGQLVLTIDTRADSISNDDQASDIITNQRQIQTTVQIKDGQTLLLGGAYRFIVQQCRAFSSSYK